jgi:hypothetical protein
MNNSSHVVSLFLSCLAALPLACSTAAIAQTVCSQSSLTGCDTQAKTAYEVCLRDNPKGSAACSNGLAAQTAACDAKYGVCGAGTTCQDGVCVSPTSCTAGLTRCGNSCTSLETDALNCGACGNVCASGQLCMAGACGQQSACNQTDFNQCSATATADYKSCLASAPDVSKQACQTSLNNAVAKCQALYGGCGGSETFYPSALLLTVLYAAPGNASSVAFSQSNSEGTTTSINNTFAHGATLTFSASGGVFVGASVDVSFGATASSQNTSSFQTTVTSTGTVGIKSTSDKVDHTQDQFYLLLNPSVTVSPNDTSATYTVGTYENQCPDIINVSAAELMNPALIDTAKLGKQNVCNLVLPGLSALCANPAQCAASDFAQFLAQDPLVSSDTTQAPADTNRFVYVNTRTLEGPDFAGQDQTPNSFAETDATVTSTGHTESQSYSVGVTVSGSAADLGIFNVQTKAGETFTWTDSTTDTNAIGTSTQASVTLSSSTVGCEESVDIYTDLMYHTFAYVVAYPACPPASGSPAFTPQLSGTVTTPKGPAGQQLVVVTLADKSVRRVYTDSKGKFILDSAPSGTVRVTAGSASAVGTIVAGKSTVLDLQLSSQ